ncbi:carbohydrate-binding domain-containing protein [Thalassiella azotivora]
MAVTTAAVLLAPPSGDAAAATGQLDTVVTATEWRADPGTGSVYRGWSGHEGEGFGLWAAGSAAGDVDLPRPLTRLVLEAGGDRCGGTGGSSGEPAAEVLVDGVPVLAVPEVDADLGQYDVRGSWSAGRRAVEVRYPADHRSPECDRNLKIARVWFDDDAPGWTRVLLRADSLDRTPASAGTVYGKGPTGEPTQLLWSNGSLTATLTTPEIQVGFLRLQVSGHLCEGGPTVVVAVDGREVGRVTADADRYGSLRHYEMALPFLVEAGRHVVTLTYGNDHRSGTCDRDLKVGTVAVAVRS